MVYGTIKSSREIDALFRHGNRAANNFTVVLATRTPEGRGPRGRVAVMAGKKVGGAVQRNRAKRVLRECVRRLGGPWDGYDVGLVARDAVLTAEADELDRMVAKNLETLGARRP